MTKIAVITGTTRPGRVNLDVAQWVLEQASRRSDAEFELVDIADWNLPLLDEAMPAGFQQYANPHTQSWAAKIAEFDGYIFVTPEYNHSISGSLKNAIDYLSVEWNNKAAGFVSYGSLGGARAVEHLRGIASELQVAHVRNQVTILPVHRLRKTSRSLFSPTAQQLPRRLDPMLDQLLPWTRAMQSLREEAVPVSR